ncbi:hypothetical protein [Limisalsivibrio acetivorans]|uniref:hypothetical protein n=1 Tax=Limisalsivibrio acetivorans TaxID=1304888 RepID=UPI0003B65A60|nr:hypothetical protein [Limisalsivibrio acetivorans]
MYRTKPTGEYSKKQKACPIIMYGLTEKRNQLLKKPVLEKLSSFKKALAPAWDNFPLPALNMGAMGQLTQ